jgi:hypothetical protein
MLYCFFFEFLTFLVGSITHFFCLFVCLLFSPFPSISTFFSPSRGTRRSRVCVAAHPAAAHWAARQPGWRARCGRGSVLDGRLQRCWPRRFLARTRRRALQMGRAERCDPVHCNGGLVGRCCGRLSLKEWRKAMGKEGRKKQSQKFNPRHF